MTYEEADRLSDMLIAKLTPAERNKLLATPSREEFAAVLQVLLATEKQ